MSMQSLKKNGQKLPKLEPEKTFLHQSGTITLLFIIEFIPFAIQSQTLLPDINVHVKFEENRSRTTQVKVRKRSDDG